MIVVDAIKMTMKKETGMTDLKVGDLVCNDNCNIHGIVSGIDGDFLFIDNNADYLKYYRKVKGVAVITSRCPQCNHTLDYRSYPTTSVNIKYITRKFFSGRCKCCDSLLKRDVVITERVIA